MRKSSTTETMFKRIQDPQTGQILELPIFDITFDKEDGALESVATFCPYSADHLMIEIDSLPLYTAAKIEEFIQDKLAALEEPADNYDHDDFMEKDAG